MTPSDRLIAAWVRWENAPGDRWAARLKVDAIHAAGLDTITAHDHIAAWRRAGYSIPDAVQTLINDPKEEAA